MSVAYRETTLTNGLRVAAEIDPQAQSSAVGYFVRTGARDETKALMGVSHFLEHMMFKGSQTRDAERVNNDLDAIGAVHNAFTGHEVTAYHAHVLPEHLDRALELVSDLFRPALRSADLEEERGVILEEIAMYADNPGWVLFEEMMDRWYPLHGLGHRVLGTPESVRGISREAMSEYFRRRYSPDNTFLVAAGRLDFEALVARAQQETADWPASQPVRPLVQPQCGSGRWQRSEQKINRSYTAMLWAGPGATNPKRYAGAVFSAILGDREGSRLYWALVEPGIAEGAEVGCDLHLDCGEFICSIAAESARADQCESLAMKTIQSIPGTITPDDLARARSKFATSATLAGELPHGRMNRLGSMLCTHGKWSPLEDELARIQAVSLADIDAMLEEYPCQPTLIGRLDPAEKKEAQGGLQAASSAGP